jgi:hypothetical protein
MKDIKATALHHLCSILDAPPDSTWEEIQQRYRALAMRYHPDRNQNDPNSPDHFRRITEAYEAIRGIINFPVSANHSLGYQVTNLKRVSIGSIKAFFDVEFHFGLIKGFKLIQQSGQRMWATTPDQSYINKEGKKAYIRIVELDKNLMNSIENEAVRLFKNGTSY